MYLEGRSSNINRTNNLLNLTVFSIHIQNMYRLFRRWFSLSLFPVVSSSLSGELYRIRKRPILHIVLMLGQSKAINDAFLYRILEIPSQAPNKNSAAARGNDTTIGVYDILPSSCMRRAYYRKKLEREVAEPKEPVMPYLIRGRAVEAAIARMLFGNATTMERHKRYEKRRIACYADLSDSKRIIEIKDKERAGRLSRRIYSSGDSLCRCCTSLSFPEKKWRYS